MWSWGAFFDFLVSPLLVRGAWTTVWLTVISMTFGLVLGLILALLRMSKSRIVRAPAGFYIWVFRGTPLLVQLVIIYAGLPTIGIKFGVLTSAVLGLSLNEAAYLSEVVRSGILSVPKGQFEAARALGMSPASVMRVVVLPQALRIMVPPLGNSLNGMLKTTTLASVISVVELLRQTQLAVQVNFRVLEGLVACACYFLALTTIWQVIQSRIELRLSRGQEDASSTGRRVKPVKDALVDPAIGGEYR